MRQKAADQQGAFELIGMEAAELESAGRKSSITMRGGFRKELTLELGTLGEPIAALQTCTDELMGHWGIDVEAHKSLTQPARPINLPEVPRMMSYPPEMIRMEMPGLVNIRLSIDEAGQMTGCYIQMPLSDPAFEESSCADLRHALEFTPALDKNGNPIASFWATTVRFVLR